MSRVRSGSADHRPLLSAVHDNNVLFDEPVASSNSKTVLALEDDEAWIKSLGLSLQLDNPTSGISAIAEDGNSKTVISVAQTPAIRTIAAANVLTEWKASVSLLKCVVGAGSFVLPSAVKDAGLILGFVSLLALGFISAYTINQLAEAGRIVAKANPGRRIPTYVDVGHAIIGEWTRPITFLGVILTLFGVCAVYLDIIGQFLSDVIDNALTMKEVQGILVFPLILLALLRDFKWLAWTSIVGDFAVVSGAITVIVFGIVKYHIASPTHLPAAHAKTFSKFFGQSVFLFAVHTVILPLSQAMKEPRKFSRVVNISYFWIVLINAVFGAMGYMIFQDKTDGLVLNNVTGKVLSKIVKIMLAVDLVFTVPIVLSAPRRLIERALIPAGDPYTTLKENLIRAGSVAIFAGLAFAISNINDLANLVGGMVSPLMGFIFPPLFNLKLYKERLPTWAVVFNWVLIVFGLFAGVFTTVQQIQSMV